MPIHPATFRAFGDELSKIAMDKEAMSLQPVRKAIGAGQRAYLTAGAHGYNLLDNALAGTRNSLQRGLRRVPKVGGPLAKTVSKAIPRNAGDAIQKGLWAFTE